MIYQQLYKFKGKEKNTDHAVVPHKLKLRLKPQEANNPFNSDPLPCFPYIY
jgi:hypothetical protein